MRCRTVYCARPGSARSCCNIDPLGINAHGRLSFTTGSLGFSRLSYDRETPGMSSTLASYGLRGKEWNVVTGGHIVVVYDSHSALKRLGSAPRTWRSRSSTTYLTDSSISKINGLHRENTKEDIFAVKEGTTYIHTAEKAVTTGCTPRHGENRTPESQAFFFACRKTAVSIPPRVSH